MAEANMPESLNERFPGNSNKQKQQEARKLDPIVKEGSAKKRKKSTGHRLRDIIDSDDTQSVIGYIFNSVLIPAAKDMIFEAVTGGLSMRMYGDTRGYSRAPRSGYTNYNKISRRPTSQSRNATPTVHENRSRFRTNYDIELSSPGEAYEVLDRLCSIIEQTGYATVNDLCQLCSLRSDYADEYSGWTSLDRARVHGNVLELPPSTPLDDLPF